MPRRHIKINVTVTLPDDYRKQGLASPAGTGLSAALKPRFAGLSPFGLPSLTQELPVGTHRGSITIES